MGRVITQTRVRAFQTLDQAFSFLSNFQKFGRVFQKFDQVLQKLGWVFQRHSRVYWSKCLRDTFDQRTHSFLNIWPVKSSLHTSHKNLENWQQSFKDIWFQFWNLPFGLNLDLFSLSFIFLRLIFFFRHWLFNQDLGILHT